MKLQKSLAALFLIVVTAISCVSCKDDDKNEPAGAEAALVGTWVDSGYDYTETYVFNANHTGQNIWRDNYGSDQISFTWSATESVITFKDEDGDTDRMSYSISSDGRILYLDGEAYYKR